MRCGTTPSCRRKEVIDSSPESDINAVSVSWVQAAAGRLHRLTGSREAAVSGSNSGHMGAR